MVDSTAIKEDITSMYSTLGMSANLNVSNQELVRMANDIGGHYYYSEETDTIWKNEDSYLRHVEYEKVNNLSK